VQAGKAPRGGRGKAVKPHPGCSAAPARWPTDLPRPVARFSAAQRTNGWWVEPQGKGPAHGAADCNPAEFRGLPPATGEGRRHRRHIALHCRQPRGSLFVGAGDSVSCWSE